MRAKKKFHSLETTKGGARKAISYIVHTSTLMSKITQEKFGAYCSACDE